jgi:hypothetical protein
MAVYSHARTGIMGGGSITEHIQQSALSLVSRVNGAGGYGAARGAHDSNGPAHTSEAVRAAEADAATLEARARSFTAAAGELRAVAEATLTSGRAVESRQAHIRAMREEVKALDDANKQYVPTHHNTQ